MLQFPDTYRQTCELAASCMHAHTATGLAGRLGSSPFAAESKADQVDRGQPEARVQGAKKGECQVH